jgi:hypothetical protein
MPDMPQGGRTGTQMAKVHPVFHNRLEELKKQAQQAHNALQGRHQRVWQVPASLSGSLLDIASLHTPAFDRDPVNAEYEQATEDPQNAGTNGDIIALKLQIDYNASEERAFRARHTTLCRAMCLGHGRRIGQGQGTLWGDKDAPGGVESVVVAFIAAGGVKPADAQGAT